ncbi:MAG TPA: sucrase ferredoxin [Trueperaceae bacterium]|jgi:hypothetical protein
MRAAPPTVQLCSLFAQDSGIDPIGYAGTLDAFLAVEVPLPWPRGLFRYGDKLPREVREATDWFAREAPYRLRLMAIAPDVEYCVPGRRRVVWYSRPDGAFADFDRHEYLVREEEVGELVADLVRRRGAAPRHAPVEAPTPARDLLVCTHGSEDAACGLFGVPVYQRLRAWAAGEARVWRVSHFGGHLFAPTVLELPSGRSWAHLGHDSARLLLERSASPEELRAHYRGWAALEGPFLQALERELLVRHGWSWLALPKRGCVLERDPADQPLWERVRIEARGPTGAFAYEAVVELHGWKRLRPRSDGTEVRDYAQYRVGAIRAYPAAAEGAAPPVGAA